MVTQHPAPAALTAYLQDRLAVLEQAERARADVAAAFFAWAQAKGLPPAATLHAVSPGRIDVTLAPPPALSGDGVDETGG